MKIKVTGKRLTVGRHPLEDTTGSPPKPHTLPKKKKPKK